MNIEQKIAFRRLLSDCLMYMSEKGRDQNEILTALDKLEDSVEMIIDTDLHVMLSIAPRFIMQNAEKRQFRQLIALTLESISRPGMKPEKILEIIDGIQEWVEVGTDKALKAAIGKPKMQVRRLPN